ncbi:MAG: DoxX family protein, partial [Nitrososphaerales archaeon]
STTIRENLWHDITHWGIRAAIGAIFIFHSIKKFDPSWQEWLIQVGLPPELQLPIALAEFLSGIFLIVGVLTRISSGVITIILLGAIFHIKSLDKFSGSTFTGWEFDLVMLAAVLSIIAAGPGRVSVTQVIKKIPRYLQ